MDSDRSNNDMDVVNDTNQSSQMVLTQSSQTAAQPRQTVAGPSGAITSNLHPPVDITAILAAELQLNGAAEEQLQLFAAVCPFHA